MAQPKESLGLAVIRQRRGWCASSRICRIVWERFANPRPSMLRQFGVESAQFWTRVRSTTSVRDSSVAVLPSSSTLTN